MITSSCVRLVGLPVSATLIYSLFWRIAMWKGTGKYADLFEGVRITDFTRCILKPAKQVGRDRIEREIHILHSLRGGVNIPLLYDIIRYGPVCQPMMILRHVETVLTMNIYLWADSWSHHPWSSNTWKTSTSDVYIQPLVVLTSDITSKKSWKLFNLLMAKI